MKLKLTPRLANSSKTSSACLDFSSGKDMSSVFALLDLTVSNSSLAWVPVKTTKRKYPCEMTLARDLRASRSQSLFFDSNSAFVSSMLIMKRGNLIFLFAHGM